MASEEVRHPLEGIYWECIKGHRFNEGRIEGVSECPECGTVFIRWQVPKK